MKQLNNIFEKFKNYFFCCCFVFATYEIPFDIINRNFYHFYYFTSSFFSYFAQNKSYKYIFNYLDEFLRKEK